jgi:ubiquitin conjugation factor E4 B
MTKLPSFNPSHTTAKTVELLSVLGPFFAKTTAFADSDPTIGEAYFPRNDMFNAAGTENELRGVFIGARNPGDVQSAMESLFTVSNNVTVSFS